MPIEQYYTQVNVTTPANTTALNPLLTPVKLGDVMLHSVRIRIPPGHSGQTGVQIRLSNNAIIPWGNITTFIVGNDDRIDFDYGDEVTSGLYIATYNIGRYPHSHFLQFINTPISLAIAGPATVTKQVII